MPLQSQILPDQLTLSQPVGQIRPTTLLPAPRFSDLPTVLHYLCGSIYTFKQRNTTYDKKNYLTPNRPLIHTSFTYRKLNMDEIYGLKFYLFIVCTLGDSPSLVSRWREGYSFWSTLVYQIEVHACLLILRKKSPPARPYLGLHVY